MKEYPYWWDTVPGSFGSPTPDPRPSAAGSASSDSSAPADSSLPARVDVAIVGAGYTGLAAARQLARAGATVLVCERGDTGWGASSRNGGQVLTGLRLDAATLVSRYGEAGARALFDIANESMSALERIVADEGIACDLHRSGHVLAACKPSHFAALRDEQALLARVFDHRVELVSRGEQRAEIGTDAYHGLLVDEHSLAINPARYVLGLADAARRAGVTVSAHTTVERVERRGSRWTVTTSNGTSDAGDLLVATNGYASAAFPPLRRRFVPVGSYIVATEPLAEADAARVLPKGRMAFDSKYFLYYFRMTADRRLLFGGRAEFSLPEPTATGRAARILHDGLRRLFPELANTAIDYAWGGNVAFTRDEMPRAGRLEQAYYAGGYGGHGVALATHLGTLIARRMAGEPIDHPLFDDRFAPIPLYYGTPWFLPAVGAYYKAKDWLS
ncbi:MAG TPA: FAD-dependent oxidoreductase [Vicinamibacterales bacterium]|nr:FAD-dependent oxidoreductase [Vicinamibacterales bacterium]